jgi:hypothetical protein
MTEAQASMLRTLQHSGHYSSHHMNNAILVIYMTRTSPYGHNPYGLEAFASFGNTCIGYLVPPEGRGPITQG